LFLSYAGLNRELGEVEGEVEVEVKNGILWN